VIPIQYFNAALGGARAPAQWGLPNYIISLHSQDGDVGWGRDPVVKKIDLHIHTVQTYCDAPFVFNLQKLQDYVANAGLGGIAITNHNCFDLAQFNLISTALQIPVLPGIEISLYQGQVLVIGDGKDLQDFAARAAQVASKNKKTEDRISGNEVIAIFGDLKKYLVIPHYEKKPSIGGEDLEALRAFISAGEVASAKKFIRLCKDPDDFTPVLFSDSRMADTLISFPTRQTYIDCGTVSFGSLKACLSDKTKVALTEKDGNSIFQIFDNGQHISTGLNVLLGERSSGKTWTLNHIDATYPGTKYIRQFALVQTSEEAYEREFMEAVSKSKSVFTEEYLASFKVVLNEVVNINLSHDDQAVGKYVESLLKFAEEQEKNDAFSNTALFIETFFPISDDKTLIALIGSVRQLIENVEYRKIIYKHLQLAALKALACELILLYWSNELQREKEKFVNGMVKTIKERLKFLSSATQTEDVDLYKVKRDQMAVEKFEDVTRVMQQGATIHTEHVQGFQMVAKRRKFDGAGELKAISKSNVAFKDAFAKYDEPYVFLNMLKTMGSIVPAEFYKYFVMIEFEVLNKDGFKVSGGERSEFRLLQEIKDAHNHSILLIDEPESSFDNLFLKDQVNQIIKEIAQSMPVVVVTHNSTVGASIKPDFVLYTAKEMVNGAPTYKVYAGHPTDKELVCLDGTRRKNFEVMMNSLEAGSATYEARKEGYENLKN
jgi:hypothetical protein